MLLKNPTGIFELAPLFVPFLACACYYTHAQSVGDLPPATIGTYNVSFLLAEVPIDLAQSLVPVPYAILLPPNKTLFPGIAEGNTPLFIELGREANAGPPLLNFESFQEAKLEVPNVKRLNSSPDTPFLYKRWIAVDNKLDVIGSLLEFGLNTTLETFLPANSSDSSGWDYSIIGAIDATLVPLSKDENPRWSLETFATVGGMPWFADYLTCAQHFYNWTALEGPTFLQGNITFRPPYAGLGVETLRTFPVQAVNGVFTFKIVGPLACEEFV